MDRPTIDAAAATIASKIAYTGAGTTIGSWMLSSEFGIIAGIIVGITGLIMNWYFQRRRDRREELEHQKRMSRLASKHGDLT